MDYQEDARVKLPRKSDVSNTDQPSRDLQYQCDKARRLNP